MTPRYSAVVTLLGLKRTYFSMKKYWSRLEGLGRSLDFGEKLDDFTFRWNPKGGLVTGVSKNELFSLFLF